MPARRPFTFDTFVPTRGSRAALDASLAAVSPAAGAPRTFVLAGPSGCGKTHLLCALAARVSGTAGSEAPIVYTTAHDLRARLVLRLRVGQPTHDLLAPPGTRLVVIDDLHTLREHPGTQHEIARAWASALRSGIAVVGACSGTAVPLATMRDALAPAGVDWIGMTQPTRAEAMLLLDTLVRAHHLVPEERGTRSVLAKWNGDVRRLVGAAAHMAFAVRQPGPSAPPSWMRSA